ncbi:MAG TPA: hypothetical protein VGF82_03060 [Terracidiphilus sp.]|jgi:hypothetical protein
MEEKNVHKDIYRFAYDEASTELRKILRAFEQLCAQKSRVEKLMEVLKPEVGLTEATEDGKHVKRTTHLPYCTVVTRLTVL